MIEQKSVYACVNNSNRKEKFDREIIVCFYERKSDIVIESERGKKRGR